MSGFLEVIAKAGEKASEVAKTEVGQAAKKFDPDKRINVEKNKKDDSKEKGFNPDKRIDIKEQLKKAVEQYIKELKENSPFPDTIKLDDLKPDKIEKVTKEKLKEMRNEFKKNKEKLIAEWEKQTGKEWPRYKEDVVKDGVVIKKKGELYDAHHIKPLSWGGKNVASNITPMAWGPHHLKVHGKDSGYNKVSNLISNTVK